MRETKIMTTGAGTDLKGTQGDLIAYGNALYLNLSGDYIVYAYIKNL